MRGLGDRGQDKRRAGAEALKKEVFRHRDSQSVRDIVQSWIDVLASDFCRSQSVHHQKGGFLGLRAITEGLGNRTAEYIHDLITAVMGGLVENDARVQQLAMEALFDIVRFGADAVLFFFRALFLTVLELHVGTESDMRQQAARLNEELHRVVVSYPTALDVDDFMEVLEEQMAINNQWVRQLIVGWVALLNGIPTIDMIWHLSKLLRGLLNMLTDTVVDIRRVSCCCVCLETFSHWAERGHGAASIPGPNPANVA